MKYMYELSVSGVSQIGTTEKYRHLTMRVFMGDKLNEYATSTDPITVMSWQSDDSSEESHWYAFVVKNEFKHNGQWKQTRTFVNWLFNRLTKQNDGYGPGFGTSPESVLRAMGRSAFRVVYDPRLSKLVKLEDVKPAEWESYEAKTGDYNFSFLVLAENESSAQQIVFELFLEEVNGVDCPISAEAGLWKWLSEDKPMKTRSNGRYNQAPIVHTDSELVTMAL